MVIMGVKNGGHIAQSLIDKRHDPHTPAAVIQEGQLATQRFFRTTLAELGRTIAEEEVKPPAVIVIGQVADLGDYHGD